MLMSLQRYDVTFHSTGKAQLMAFGEDELQHLARILARSGYDFQVVRDFPQQVKDQDTKPEER